MKKIIYIIIITLIIVGLIYTKIKENKYEEIKIEETNINNIEEKENELIKIHIAGAVILPGVIELNEGSRITDQTTTNMILIIKSLFVGKPLISIGI